MVKRKQTNQKWIFLGSFLILIFSLTALILFLVDNGIILESRSNLFNGSRQQGYRAFDIVFGVKDGDNQLIEPTFWGIVGYALIGLGGIAVLFRALGSFRYLLSLLSFIGAFILTLLIPNQADLIHLNWGDLVTIEAKLGIPMIITLVLLGINGFFSLFLFATEWNQS